MTTATGSQRKKSNIFYVYGSTVISDSRNVRNLRKRISKMESELVHVVFYNNGNIQGVYSGRDTAIRYAKWIDGYIIPMQLDTHITPLALR